MAISDAVGTRHDPSRSCAGTPAAPDAVFDSNNCALNLADRVFRSTMGFTLSRSARELCRVRAGAPTAVGAVSDTVPARREARLTRRVRMQP
jgi:hypothetical protein